MSREWRSDFEHEDDDELGQESPRVAPGKVTLTSQIRSVMRRAAGPRPEASPERVNDIADRGFSGPGGEVPYRSEMEELFGTSFADVRTHSGPNAREASQALSARAFAQGSDIAFAEANPSRELVAHELTHVVQARGDVQTKSAISSPEDALEREADRVAARVAVGEPAHELTARYEGGAASSVAAAPMRKAHTWGKAPASRPLWGVSRKAATIFRDPDPPAQEGQDGVQGGGAQPARGGGAAEGGNDPDAAQAEEEAKKLAEFKKKTYSQKNHVPSTGYGAFDVEYVPAGGALNISVRCHFIFKNTDQAQWGGSGLFSFIRKYFDQAKWLANYRAVIAARWGNRYTMKCTKKYWEELVANTNVRIVSDSSNPHFKLTIHKTTPTQTNPGSSIDVPNNYKVGAPGDNPAWKGTLEGRMRSNAIPGKSDWRSAAVRGTDAQRMRDHIPADIRFDNNSDTVKAENVAGLQQFGQMLSMTQYPKLTVNVVGRASSTGTPEHNMDLGQRRANNVVGVIRRGGTIVHTMAVSSRGAEGADAGEEWRRVDINVPDMPDTFKNQYDVGSHEFGHMLGLDDEYQGGPKSEHYKLVEEAFGTEVANTFLSREASSGSLMSSGLDVRPYHYVTFWEALGRVTEPTLSRSDWQITT